MRGRSGIVLVVLALLGAAPGLYAQQRLPQGPGVGAEQAQRPENRMPTAPAPPASVDQAQPSTVAVVDMARVIEASQLGAALEREIGKHNAAFQRAIADEQQDIYNAGLRLAADRAGLTREAYAKRQRELEDRIEAFRLSLRDRERQLNDLIREKTLDMAALLEGVIEEVKVERDLSAVITRQSAIGKADLPDVTHEVIARLDRRLVEPTDTRAPLLGAKPIDTAAELMRLIDSAVDWSKAIEDLRAVEAAVKTSKPFAPADAVNLRTAHVVALALNQRLAAGVSLTDLLRIGALADMANALGLHGEEQAAAVAERAAPAAPEEPSGWSVYFWQGAEMQASDARIRRRLLAVTKARENAIVFSRAYKDLWKRYEDRGLERLMGAL